MLLFALILGVASPVAKYVVNNHGEAIVGRQLHADQVIINPFWGGVSIKGFECKEANGETNFISFDRLYVQIAYPQLIAKRVKIRAIHLDGFNGQVLKSRDRLNFSDIIERFTKPETEESQKSKDESNESASKWTIALDDIRINNSSLRYRDVISDKQWKVEDISLTIPGLFFDNTQTNAGLEFGLPTGGRVGIIAGYKMQSNRYAVRLNLQDVHTDVALPLVQDYLNVSGLGAKINGQLHVDGSLDNITNVQLKGALSMAGLSIQDTHDEQVAAMAELREVVNKGDQPEDWLESSCTCLYAAALCMAVRQGFMEKDALKPALKAVKGIFERLGEDENGLLIGNVCVGTGVGDYPFYCARPTSTNDLHGVGAFLLMCAEAAKAV